jgi:phage tail sheath protein FI
MATYNRPGVYVEETLTVNPITARTSGTVAAFLGAASKGPVTPTLVTSWSQYASLYGSWDSTNTVNNTLTQAVNLFFANGGASAYVQRVLNTTTAVTTGTVGFTAVTTIATTSSVTVVLTTAPAGLATGQTVSGNGIPSNTTVTNWVSGTKTVTLSLAASIPAAATLTFGSTAVTLAASNALLGSSAIYSVSGTGVPANTTATVSGTAVTLSKAVTNLVSGATLTFNLDTPAFVVINDQAGTPAPTLGLAAKYPGAWGNNLYYAITASSLGSSYFNLLVYLGGYADSNLVERFTDVTMLNSNSNYVVSVVNATSGYVFATDSNPSDAHTSADNPAAVAASSGTKFSAGNDGYSAASPIPSNVIAAKVSAFDAVTTSLVLNAPGLTATGDVATLTSYAEARGDVFVVIDSPLGVDVTDQLNLANTYTATSYGAVYYPNLVIPNPQSSVPGSTTSAYNGGAVVAKYVTTDASRGVFKSPAGLNVNLAGVVAVPSVTNTELDNLNVGSASGSSGSVFTPVNAIRYIPGSGFVIMGARTLKNGYSDRYVSVRRSLIYLRKQLTDLTAFAIFEPNDQRLWNRIVNTVETELISFWQSGGLRGNTFSDAFYIKCDGTTNTQQTIANGQVILEVGVALQRPAEFVVIRISQYDSGSVVTVL